MSRKFDELEHLIEANILMGHCVISKKKSPHVH
jgi:hypothetical protein